MSNLEVEVMIRKKGAWNSEKLSIRPSIASLPRAKTEDIMRTGSFSISKSKLVYLFQPATLLVDNTTCHL